MNSFLRQADTHSSLSSAERPTFNEIQDNANVGVVRRGMGRYFFSRNPERSVKMYTYLGMPILRKAIMGTYGRRLPADAATLYRTRPDKSMIERSMRFAVGGSVFNEGVHTASAAATTYFMMDQIAEGRSPTLLAAAAGVNTALVGLQRYNRARMIQRINQELQEGRTFDPKYRNWLGIDGRAVANHEASLERIVTDPATLPLIEQVHAATAVPATSSSPQLQIGHLDNQHRVTVA